MGTNLIEAKGISAGYQSHEVFRDLSLSVADGGNVSILGASGSGKSTLLKILAGVKRPSAGTVDYGEVDGRPVRTGLMFQHPLLLPWLTVEQNVALGDRYHSHEDGSLDPAELIYKVGLSGHARRRPAELSGGQRKRVALARTLAHRPDVLLLDEPFSALDVELRGSLHYLVQRLAAERNIPIVLVTHHHDEATLLGGAIVNMEDIGSVGPPRRPPAAAGDLKEVANV